VVEGIIGISIAAVVTITVYVSVIVDAVANLTDGSIEKTLMQGLFPLMLFLGISLLPLTILYKALKTS
jgi:hypothetical protein